MSGNEARSRLNSPAKLDRRVAHTRDILGGALIELMQEQPFEQITVQQVLDRAGVGRSTFYQHYRDKDDLFLSEVEDFFQLVSTSLTRNNAPGHRLAPVAELFDHVASVRAFYLALRSAGKLDDVQALGRGLFARAIAERLRLAGIRGEPWQLAAQAAALSGSLFALLDHWLNRRMSETPQQVDALFHVMAWKGVAPSPVSGDDDKVHGF